MVKAHRLTANKIKRLGRRYAPKKETPAIRAHREMVKKLIAQGWTPEGAGIESLYREQRAVDLRRKGL